MHHLSIITLFALFLINPVFAQHSEIEALPANPHTATSGTAQISSEAPVMSLVGQVPAHR